jgi:DNA-binding response OmpR family regulator
VLIVEDESSIAVPLEQHLAREGFEPTVGASNARAWWESGRTYYVVKLSLGGTVAGLTSHAEVDADDVSGIL